MVNNRLIIYNELEIKLTEDNGGYEPSKFFLYFTTNAYEVPRTTPLASMHISNTWCVVVVATIGRHTYSSTWRIATMHNMRNTLVDYNKHNNILASS